MASIFLITALTLLYFTMISSQSSNYYTAAVYEHVRLGNSTIESMLEVITKNLIVYNNATKTAAEKGADIIVFPEFGLHDSTTREKLKTIAEYVPSPDVNWNPCTSPRENSFVLTNLSCTARQNNIFLVANMLSQQVCDTSNDKCPSDEIYLYNTNVVFDRNGKLIARYRKYHLYFEPGINIPKKPEYITFETDFGKFGTFICFDVIWKESIELLKNHNVDAIAYTSLWFDHLPFYTSIQTMFSWSLRNKINFLSSNLQNPSKGNVGSGVYNGASGIADYIYQPNGKPKLTLAKLPRPGTNWTEHIPPIIIEFENEINQNHVNDINNISSGVCSLKMLGPPKNELDYRCREDDLSNYTMVKLQNREGITRVCNNDLCCIASYKSSTEEEDYYLAAFSGNLYINEENQFCQEVCMIVRCDPFEGKQCNTFPTKSSTTFYELDISGNFTTEYVYPNVLVSGINLLPAEEWSHTNISLSLQSTEGVLSASLVGRCYEKDVFPTA